MGRIEWATMKNYKSSLWLVLLAFLPLWCFGATNTLEAVPLVVTGAPAHPYDIPVWFLVLGLIFPRITFLIAYFGGTIPPNDIPFWGDFFLALFLPRVLMLIYIYGCMGLCVWFWVHLVVCILAYLGGVRSKVVVKSEKKS